jgi:hypothetical protein
MSRSMSPHRQRGKRHSRQPASTSPKRPISQPNCFGCGPDRHRGNGLRQVLGLLPGRHLGAAAWIPAPALGNRDANLPTELTWAALDCPGGVARSRLTDPAAPPSPPTSRQQYSAQSWLANATSRSAGGSLAAAAKRSWAAP